MRELRAWIERARHACLTRPLKQIAITIAAACLVFFPFLTSSRYYIHISVLCLLYVVLSLGLSVLVGFTGLLNLGYVAFYAVGAYSYAILSTRLNLPFWLGFPLGGCLACLFGLAVGLPAIRTRGDYLALVTLGFGESTRLLLRNWDAVTNGPRGITGIKPPSLFGLSATNPAHFYYLMIGFAFVAVLAVVRLRRSRIGAMLMAVRDDELAASSIGINPVRWKLFSFAVSAFIAGSMGVFFAAWQRFVSPESFNLLESVFVLAIVILGGMGSIAGTIASAVFLVLLPEMLRDFLQYRMLVFGILLIVVVIIQQRRKASASTKAYESAKRPTARTGVLSASFQDLPSQPHSRRIDVDATLLRCKGIIKSFDGLAVLKSVSIAIPSDSARGETPNESIPGIFGIGLIGPNGAGKSTLINCISGILPPDSGEIEIGGRIVFSRREGRRSPTVCWRPYEVARAGVARTFQRPRLFQSMTVSQNVLTATYATASGRQDKGILHLAATRGEQIRSHETVSRLLDWLELGQVSSTVVSHLPLAMQRRVEIGRALALNPFLLFLDEPASGLNEAEKEEFRRLLENLPSRFGTTVVLIDHDMGLLLRVSQRVLCLSDGVVIADGTPSYVREQPAVVQAYLGTGD